MYIGGLYYALSHANYITPIKSVMWSWSFPILHSVFLSSSFRMFISNLIPIIFLVLILVSSSFLPPFSFFTNLVLILISSSPSFSLSSSSPAHPYLHPNAHTHLFFVVYLREATVTWSWEANLYICSTRDNSLIKTVKCSIFRDKIFIQYTECIYQFFSARKALFPYHASARGHCETIMIDFFYLAMMKWF